MFKIGDNFLAELGLAALPQAEKERMKAHIYETLEYQVGMQLASGMSNEQLDEFESFMNGDIQKCTDFLSRLNPNWQTAQDYQAALEQNKKASERAGRQPNPNAVLSEYAALKWLETNFPNYKQVVAGELEKLKNEIKVAAPQILAEAANPPAQQ